MNLSLRSLAVVVVCQFVLAGSLAGKPRDDDRDGMPDKLEQSLLERFAPEFVTSPGECDGLPAELVPGAAHPLVKERNAVIYGQAFRLPHASGRFVELRYFHLWGRDCGRVSHALDAEHVSAIVEAPKAEAPARQWRARYWFAAGHEGTVCDRSTGASAAAVQGAERGPRVWISAGKHASYLDPAWCSWGCGADRCANSLTRGWRPARILNLGEAGAPLSGATWAASPRWSLAAKLTRRSDLRVEWLAALDRAPGPILLWPELRPAQSVLMAGAEAGAALAESGRRTSAALRLADTETSAALTAATEAVGASLEKTGRALKRSARGVSRFLGYRGSVVTARPDRPLTEASKSPR